MRMLLVAAMTLLSLCGYAQSPKHSVGADRQIVSISEIHTLAIGEGTKTQVQIGIHPTIKSKHHGHALTIKPTSSHASDGLRLDQIRIQHHDSANAFCIQLPGLQLGDDCELGKP